MKKIMLLCFVSVILMMSSGLQAQTVGDVAAWNVGSGQPNGEFVRNYLQTFRSNELTYQIEFALRAQERFVGPYSSVYDNNTGIHTFTVPAGINGTAAIWNFDLSVNVWVKPGSPDDTMLHRGTMSDITALTLGITSDNGMNPITANLLDPATRGAIDAHTIPAMGGDPADPTHFYQFSQNLSWWPTNFDPYATGTYSFSIDLKSVAGDYPAAIFGPLMNVTVVPEPATLVMLGLGAVGLLRKRK